MNKMQYFLISVILPRSVDIIFSSHSLFSHHLHFLFVHRYDEVCDYNFDKPSFAPRVGHFTEVVWSNSRKFGVGYAVGKNAKFPGYACVYVVGRYRPAGNNMESQRLEANVKRGNFNNAYCIRRSKAPAFTLIPVDKRYQLQASRRASP